MKANVEHSLRENPYNNAAAILGCRRSETLIFGELIESLPMYSYHGEPPFDEVVDMAQKQRRYEDLVVAIKVLIRSTQ
ncbi:MAG: hypothetical protein JKX83_02190 [Pseudomonadales bacterium]|nr:hypothetical protein [Pseudomonadales bacterium]